jgi:DNA-binding beta-propeller fold protein YncE
VPFGFAFGRAGTLVVSEAGNSTVSSYTLGATGVPSLVTPSLPVGQAAACWVVASPDGRFAYVLNAAGQSISGFAIGADSTLTALTPGGRTAASPRPNDGAFSRSGEFLYAINPPRARSRPTARRRTAR